MRILLDTHIFLWCISGDTQLSTDIRDAIRELDNGIYLSAVSVWEAIVKYQLGKLPLPEHPETYLPKQRDRHQITSLSLEGNSVVQLSKLQSLHRDPIDRMLICQALQNFPAVSAKIEELLLHLQSSILMNDLQALIVGITSRNGNRAHAKGWQELELWGQELITILRTFLGTHNAVIP